MLGHLNPTVLLLLTAAGVWGQEPPRFQTRAHEVEVPVSVMSKRGKPVENLAASDFLVLSDRRPETVRMIARDSEAVLPVHALIVLQTSGSSEAVLAKIKKTASVVSIYITNYMGMGVPSLAAVIEVADEVRIEQDFTSDPDLLGDAFAKIKATGDSGRLLDGVSLACDLLAKRPEPARRVIVLISESRDQHSKAQFAEVVVKAQRSDVVIYALSYSAYTTGFTQKVSDRPPLPDELGVYDPNAKGAIDLLAIGMALAQLAKVNIADALTQATGGAHEKFATLRGLETRLTAIGTEIHNRYTLTFVPPEGQLAGYHRLAVRLRRGGDMAVHARAGYWSGME